MSPKSKVNALMTGPSFYFGEVTLIFHCMWKEYLTQRVQSSKKLWLVHQAVCPYSQSAVLLELALAVIKTIFCGPYFTVRKIKFWICYSLTSYLCKPLTYPFWCGAQKVERIQYLNKINACYNGELNTHVSRVDVNNYLILLLMEG